ncbi:hypothetical protein A9975_25060 [Cupriavidus sp. UME77]|nr:hypothetical protein [Cupriavidus sp. UME77]
MEAAVAIGTVASAAYQGSFSDTDNVMAFYFQGKWMRASTRKSIEHGQSFVDVHQHGPHVGGFRSTAVIASGCVPCRPQ